MAETEAIHAQEAQEDRVDEGGDEVVAFIPAGRNVYIRDRHAWTTLDALLLPDGLIRMEVKTLFT